MTISANRAALVAVLTASFCLAACERPEPAGQAAALPTGYWQAAISLPGAAIETGIEISRDGDVYRASLINGQERVRIDDVRYADGELLLRFAAFNNEIRATLVDGRLSGELTLIKRHGRAETMPFAATPGSAAVQEAVPHTRYDLSGRWAVRFHEPDGTDTHSIGEFSQRGTRLFGTFLNPDGDHRFLAGHVRGNEFHLSTFDGAHAFVFSGFVDEAGEIVNADFWSGTSWHQLWSARRDNDVQLPDAFSRTWLKPGYERFEFEFPDQDGNIVSLADDRYRGKVVLVTIAGTWCPNCNDEARYLARFHDTLRSEGLEVVALLFEHFEDADLAAEQVRLFRAKHGIGYDTLIAGISDKEVASKTLPALSAVLAFPTTLFIDRSGRVRHIHTGFSGPGTGDHYVRLQETFRQLVTDLLAEPPNLLDSLIGDDPLDPI